MEEFMKSDPADPVAAVRVPRLQDQEEEEVTRVAPSVPCVERIGSTAEERAGDVTAEELTDEAEDYGDEDDRMGEPWCRDFDGHRAAHEFCGDHQAAWCRVCDRQCPECVDDPHCSDCGCALFTDNHDWDCGYAGDEDDDE